MSVKRKKKEGGREEEGRKEREKEGRRKKERKKERTNERMNERKKERERRKERINLTPTLISPIKDWTKVSAQAFVIAGQPVAREVGRYLRWRSIFNFKVFLKKIIHVAIGKKVKKFFFVAILS